MEPVRVTLKDIANECGYSVNTVSRALRGDTKLSEQTRKKIQQTAKEKGYIRNNLASSLRSGASHIIAVIVNDIRNQHFTSMISEIELFLRQAGYDMMILCTQLEEQGRQIGTQMVHVAISQSVDGILYFPYSDDKPVVAFLEQSGVPFVLVDRWIPGVYADLVRCDDVSGGYLAGRHLLELGHKRFAYIRGPMNNSAQVDREAGFLKKLKEAGIPDSDIRVIGCGDMDSAIKNNAIMELLNPLDYTAILAFNDEIAYRIINTFRTAHVKIPKDISLMGFDHIRKYVPYHAPLTSIFCAQVYNIGEIAVDLLLERITNPDMPKQARVLPVKIYNEGTTGAPRKLL